MMTFLLKCTGKMIKLLSSGDKEQLMELSDLKKLKNMKREK